MTALRMAIPSCGWRDKLREVTCLAQGHIARQDDLGEDLDPLLSSSSLPSEPMISWGTCGWECLWAQ